MGKAPAGRAPLSVAATHGNCRRLGTCRRRSLVHKKRKAAYPRARVLAPMKSSSPFFCCGHRYLCSVSLVIKCQGCVCVLKVVEGFVLFPILLCNPIQELCAILLVLGVVPLILLKGQVVPLLFIQCGLTAVAGQILREIVASDESGRVKNGPANHDSDSRHCVYVGAYVLVGSIF